MICDKFSTHKLGENLKKQKNNKKNKFYKTIEKYLEVIPKSKLVLEYGCSIGITTKYISDSSEMVFGIDKSFNAIHLLFQSYFLKNLS